MIKSIQVLSELKSKYGIEVGSVQQLNKILEKMGIIVRTSGGWLHTDAGVKFSPFGKFYRANERLPNKVDHIARNVKNTK